MPLFERLVKIADEAQSSVPSDSELLPASRPNRPTTFEVFLRPDGTVERNVRLEVMEAALKQMRLAR